MLVLQPWLQARLGQRGAIATVARVGVGGREWILQVIDQGDAPMPEADEVTHRQGGARRVIHRHAGQSRVLGIDQHQGQRRARGPTDQSPSGVERHQQRAIDAAADVLFAQHAVAVGAPLDRADQKRIARGQGLLDTPQDFDRRSAGCAASARAVAAADLH